MIRIKLLDGEVVETKRHTFEQATAAVAAGVPILVGGPEDFIELIGDGEGAAGVDVARPERTIYPAAIGSIERGDLR